MNIDTEGLRTFVAVHRCGGFARAGDFLHRSQPAVSRRISVLEDQIGGPLFQRDARSEVRLTLAGLALLPWAERAVAALEDFRAAVRDLQQGASGPVEIAIVGTLANSGLANALRSMRRRHPGVDIQVRTALSREVSELVRLGEVAFGIRYHADSDPSLECQHVLDERLVVISAHDHPRAAGGSVRLSDLSEEPWFAFPNAGNREASADSIFAHFLACGISGLRWSPIDSLTAQKRFVEAGLGLALVPASAVEDELAAERLATVDIDDLKAQNPVYLVKRRESYLSPAAQEFAAEMHRQLALDAR